MTRSSLVVRAVLPVMLAVLAHAQLRAEVDPAAKKESTRADATDTGVNPLEDAITRMRAAQERMQKKDTGAETRAIQQQVVSDLQKLIDMAKQASPNRPQQPSSQQKQQQRQDSDANGKKNGQQQEQQANGPDKKDNAASSQARSPQADQREAQILDQRGTAAVWGHLPQKLREELRNVDAGKTLSKYSDLVRRYYQALAEQNKNPPDNAPTHPTN